MLFVFDLQCIPAKLINLYISHSFLIGGATDTPCEEVIVPHNRLRVSRILHRMTMGDLPQAALRAVFDMDLLRQSKTYPVNANTGET